MVYMNIGIPETVVSGIPLWQALESECRILLMCRRSLQGTQIWSI